ncbi:hypothetical protein KM043_000506 [Ampulex compressa]|nr:hypothetical protein KM043_000506 [Ampulex compressa]
MGSESRTEKNGPSTCPRADHPSPPFRPSTELLDRLEGHWQSWEDRRAPQMCGHECTRCPGSFLPPHLPLLFLLLLLLLLLPARSTLAATYAPNPKFVEVHEMDRMGQEMSPMDRLPPQDPAVHSFPTVPTVPLIPTCMRQGYFRDPFNCGKFYLCEYEYAVPTTFYCQSGLIFSVTGESCERPEYVDC